MDWCKFLLLWALWLTQVAGAKRILLASSLTTCMDNSQISPSFFNVTFNPEDSSVHYTIDLTTELQTYVYADVQVFVYGFRFINERIDLCKIGWKQFCPIFPGSLQIDSVMYIDKEYTDRIPGPAYIVPDIDAVVKVLVHDNLTGEVLLCIQASFTNGRTVNQTGAKWATAVVAGIGLIVAALMSTFGNSNAASHVAANAMSLFLYFQLVVLVLMQAVERVPPIAAAWSENLAWLMGLIRVTFMQKIFRWYVQLTGGLPTLYLLHTTKQVLVERATLHLAGLAQMGRRALALSTGYALEMDTLPLLIKQRDVDYALKSNLNLVVLRGIKRMGYKLGIEPTSVVVTGFTWFVLIGYVLVGLLLLCKLVLWIMVKKQRKPTKHLYSIRNTFPQVVKGLLLRYIFIGFLQLCTLSLWEFTVHDLAAVVVLAVIFLVLLLALVAYSLWRVLQFGRRSVREYNNPAAILYGDSHVLNKFGYCYTMFDARVYWFGAVVIGYFFIRAIFVGLCQGSGKASSLVLWIVDMAYTAVLFWKKPYLNRPTNIINYLIAIVNTINSFLFTFFSGVYGQPAAVALIMGWVFFVLNAAFSLILLVMILVFTGFALLSKNPDSRFAPAKDDRFSFQNRYGKDQANVAEKLMDLSDLNDTEDHAELLALGMAAQDHSNNWEQQMYRLSDAKGAPNGLRDIFTPTLDQGPFADSSEDLLTKEPPAPAHDEENLSLRLKSIGRKWLKKRKNKTATRMSDTLLEESRDSVDQLPEPRPTLRYHARNQLQVSLNMSFNNAPTEGAGFL